jgi:hypothetical protein
LLAAVGKGTTQHHIAIAKKAGILDEGGKLADLYKSSWGKKVTHTPTFEQMKPKEH